jgi:hypothetical protein
MGFIPAPSFIPAPPGPRRWLKPSRKISQQEFLHSDVQGHFVRGPVPPLAVGAQADQIAADAGLMGLDRSAAKIASLEGAFIGFCHVGSFPFSPMGT